MIILKNITRSFGEVVAVSRLNMHVQKGSITGFLGPNGAGKSSTLKIIMGELKPDEGFVQVLKENPWNNIAIRRKIGYVSEFEDLYYWMNAGNFVTFMARFYMPKEEAIAASKAILTQVNLKTTKPIGSFSKGMKQRVKLAAALVSDPELLILDEPFNGLDPIGRKEMKDLLARLNKERGLTILFSSHILYEVEEISSHIIMIHRGQLIAEGKPSAIVDLIDRYPHTIVFNGKTTELKQLSKLLIDLAMIKTINIFSTTEENSQIEIVTESPAKFYPAITQLVCDNNIHITGMESQTDNIEAIFGFLTK